MAPMVLVVVALGGALGASLRWSLNELIGPAAGGFPWATLVENVSGSLVLGLVVVVLRARWPHRHLVGPFLGAGVLGGYTTFSTFSADARLLLAAGDVALALAYVGVTLAAGIAAVRLGAALGRSWVGAQR
jgi:fluoride exporter